MLIYENISKKIPFFKIQYGLTYFDEPYDRIAADIIQEWQYSKRRLFSDDFYTLCIDLTKDKEIIFSNFEKNTKYEINRAKNKDAIVIVTLDEQKQKNEFYEFYNAFAKSKSLLPIGEREVDFLIDNDMFKIRAALYNNETLVYHTYITANKRVRLMQSASLFRDISDNTLKNLTGRANRLLHWDDICYFKNNGYLLYDFGGISMDKSDQERQAINKFKECFGGMLIKEYKSYVPGSLKGFVCLCYKKLTGKI